MREGKRCGFGFLLGIKRFKLSGFPVPIIGAQGHAKSAGASFGVGLGRWGAKGHSVENNAPLFAAIAKICAGDHASAFSV